MPDPRFFEDLGPVSLDDLARLTGAQPVSPDVGGRTVDRVAVLARKKVLVADRLDVVAATDDAWIQEYFHGPRGRAAAQAAAAAGSR